MSVAGAALWGVLVIVAILIIVLTEFDDGEW